MEEPAQGGEAVVSSSTSSSVIVQVDQSTLRKTLCHNLSIITTTFTVAKQAAEPALAQAPPPIHGLPQVFFSRFMGFDSKSNQVKQLPQPQPQKMQRQQLQQGFREVQPIQPQLVMRK